MLKLFSNPWAVSVKSVTVNFGENDDDEVDFKTCKQALEAVQEFYEESTLLFDFDDINISSEFYNENCIAVIDFHNSDDVLEITSLEHLKELARN